MKELNLSTFPSLRPGRIGSFWPPAQAPQLSVLWVFSPYKLLHNYIVLCSSLPYLPLPTMTPQATLAVLHQKSAVFFLLSILYPFISPPSMPP